MKKRIIILTLLISITGVTNAQTWEEIFDQKKTQTKYLMEQVAALRVYIGHVKKTYQIAKDGLGFIGDMTSGERKLHSDFFRSLQVVKPEIGKYSRVAEIVVLQVQTMDAYKRYYKQTRESNMLQADELDYIKGVYNRLLADCGVVLDDLILVMTSNSLEMKDDERIRRIDALFAQMQDNYAFAEKFGSGIIQLAISRKNAEAEVQNSRKLNNLK